MYIYIHIINIYIYNKHIYIHGDLNTSQAKMNWVANRYQNEFVEIASELFGNCFTNAREKPTSQARIGSPMSLNLLLLRIRSFNRIEMNKFYQK